MLNIIGQFFNIIVRYSNIIGLFFNIIGGSFLFCQSLVMRVRYDEKGNSVAEVDLGRANWCKRNAAIIGMGCLVFGFILQVIYSCIACNK